MKKKDRPQTKTKNKEPNKNTEYRIAKGCNPNLSPIIFGDKKQASNKKAIKNIAII